MFKTSMAIVIYAGSLSCVTAEAEPNAGSWKTYVIANGKELRAEPPPSAAATAGELAWLRNYMTESRRSDEAMKQMRYWTAGPPAYRWVDRMLNLIETRGFSNPKNARNFALLNVAIHDATIAAWESKNAYNRQRPAVVDPGLQTPIKTPQSPSYPSEHAAAAGAASEFLAYLYPADAQSFRNLGEEAARAALTAGINFPSDVIAGLKLGRSVVSKVVALAQSIWGDQPRIAVTRVTLRSRKPRGAEPHTKGVGRMSKIRFRGLDVHAATIAVAVAEPTGKCARWVFSRIASRWFGSSLQSSAPQRIFAPVTRRDPRGMFFTGN
jgi:hypothetical protein